MHKAMRLVRYTAAVKKGERFVAQRTQKFNPRQYMLRQSFEIYRYRDSYLHDVALHHHDFYEIYLFINGNVDYIIESRNYHLVPGDILLISPLELHQPRITMENDPYERMVLWVNKAFLERFSTPDTSLTRCFDPSQPNHTNLLRLPPAQRQLITTLLEQVLRESNDIDYGRDIACFGYLLQLMVELNRLTIAPRERYEMKDKSAPFVADVLSYINEHYSEELSLDSLAAQFFISKYHLSHEFQRLVGTSVYRYIIQKRLVIAKQMLSDGVPPTDVYSHCGFGDYANFYRAFKSSYGMNPKEYVQHVRKNTLA